MVQIQKNKQAEKIDNLTALLSQKEFVNSAPTIAELAARIDKCKQENRPLKVLYGETFDELGNTIDSMKYYLFTSLLTKELKSHYGIDVKSTVLIADLGVYRNYPNQVDELKKHAESRKEFAERVKDLYGCEFEVKLLSEISATPEFKVRLDRAVELGRTDSTLMGMIKATVPEDRREASEKAGYIYSFEEIATILGIDIKIGPPREKLYDMTANAMLSHFNVAPLLPIYLAQTYPLGVSYESYINSPIKEYGLTAYKAGSGHMTKNRIIIGNTSNSEIERLIDNTEISTDQSKPNSVLDLMFIADLARQHIQKGSNMSAIKILTNKYMDGSIDSNDLKARTYSGLQKYVFSLLPDTRPYSIGVAKATNGKELDIYSNAAVTGFDHDPNFNISQISQEIKEFFSDKTTLFERDLVINHTDFDKIVERIQKKQDFIIISGFSASGEFHYGHKAVIDTYKFFRQYAKSGYFVISDMDAYVSRPDSSIPDLKTAQRYAVENIADALALGVAKDDIKVQSKQVAEYYNLTLQVSKKLSFNLMKGVLGHTDLGKYTAVYLQIADILHPQLENGPSFTLVPVGLDQKPILRLTNEMVEKSKRTFDFVPPAVLYTAHLPSLINYKDKMSKSKKGSALLLNSTEQELDAVIAAAVTAGRDTKAEQIKYGGIPGMCPIYELYRFNHPDSKFVTGVFSHCMDGTLLCGADKSILKDFLRDGIKQHISKRAEYIAVAEEIMRR